MQKHCLLFFCDTNIFSFIIILGKHAIINKHVIIHSSSLRVPYPPPKKGGDVTGWCIFLGNGKAVYMLVAVILPYQVTSRLLETPPPPVISRLKVEFSYFLHIKKKMVLLVTYFNLRKLAIVVFFKSVSKFGK